MSLVFPFKWLSLKNKFKDWKIISRFISIIAIGNIKTAILICTIEIL